jgi:ATP-dependent exoDNAse (exonuclease V) alpha subunit
MFLNNDFLELGISNGTYGIIIALQADGMPMVSFPTSQRLQTLIVQPTTYYFKINGISYSRTQLSLQNAFALTVHKTQGLTLSKIAVSFDAGMFACDHTYTTLSRARRWEDVDIIKLYTDAFKVDVDVVKEYERFQTMHNTIINRTIAI